MQRRRKSRHQRRREAEFRELADYRLAHEAGVRFDPEYEARKAARIEALQGRFEGWLRALRDSGR